MDRRLNLVGGFAILGASVVFQPILNSINTPVSTQSNPSSLIIIGNMEGNLEPCGCTSPMTGGLKRLGTLVSQYRTGGHSAFLLINGGVIQNIGTQSSVGVKQSILKAKLVAETANALKPSLMNIDSHLKSYGQNLIAELQILAPNLLVNSLPEPSVKDSIPNFRSIGPFLVGAANGEAFSSGSNSAQAISQLVFQAMAKGRQPILLLDGNLSQAKDIASNFPQLKLIAYASKGTAPLALTKVADVPLISCGDNGKEAAIISWNGKAFDAYHAQPLTPNYQDDPKVKNLFSNYLDEVDRENLLAQLPRVKTEKYVGSQACLSCHADSYKTWIHSSHAHAYHDLVAQGHQNDPDCVQCHVTALGSDFGFKSLKTTPQLANVTCESCHGPGKMHIEFPRTHPMLDGKQACISCHTTENSPNFDFDKYWHRIMHK